MVEYSMDVLILKPVDLSRGNGQVLYHMNNRGNLGFLASLNNGGGGNNPTTAADATRANMSAPHCEPDASATPPTSPS